MEAQGKDLIGVVQRDRPSFIAGWLADAGAGKGSLKGLNEQLQAQATRIADQLVTAIEAGASPSRFDAAEWDELRGTLSELSASLAAQGVDSGETSRIVLSIKRPFFEGLQKLHGNDAQAALERTWWASGLADRMAQHTVTTFQRTREDTIRRQQQELLELSTPVIKLWEGILAVPMIGTLDSSRTQLVMEALLQRIVETGAELAIIDITGVPTVDTLVAQHLLKTVTAIRLMGAECLISGIRPQIAQTIVHLGIDLGGIMTKATLADALAVALKRTGYTVTRSRA
jgi:rsbT co-antagonist protein RsbR